MSTDWKNMLLGRVRRPVRTLWAIVPLCLWGLVLRFQARARLPLWGDEHWQLDQMQGSFMDMLRSLPIREFCAYLSGDYYLIFPFFKIFGYNKWGLAIPHLIATLLGFVALFYLCRRNFRTIWGYVIPFTVVCLNATLVYHALEIRTYVVLALHGIVCLYFTQILVQDYPSLSRRQKIGLGVYFLITVLWHAYGFLIVGYPLFYWLGTRLRRPEFKAVLARTAKFFLWIALPAAPIWLISVFGQNCEINWYYTFEYIPNPRYDLGGFLRGVLGTLVGFRPLWILYLGIPLAFLVSAGERMKQMAFLGVLIIIPLQAFLIIDCITEYYFIQRQFIFLIPWMAFFLGWCWESVLLRWIGGGEGHA